MTTFQKATMMMRNNLMMNKKKYVTLNLKTALNVLIYCSCLDRPNSVR